MAETRRRTALNGATQPEDEEAPLPSSENKYAASWTPSKANRRHQSTPRDPTCAILTGLVMILLFLFTLVYMIIVPSKGDHVLPRASSCDTISQGYQCNTPLSHTWGQYSPFYLVDSDISTRTPTNCTVTFTQLLSRHGARSPTADKASKYNATLSKISSTATNFSGPYSFLETYTYPLGADILTDFGRQELINSGIDFFTRYESLAASTDPFIRASAQDRVIESAQKWSQGFHRAKIASGATNDSGYPFPILEISEEGGMNNTLNHGNCPAFEADTTGATAQAEFAKTFVPGITARLNRDLLMPEMGGLEDAETVYLMDLCPFATLVNSSTANAPATMTGFCALFTMEEWVQYDYYQTLGKYYGFGAGNPLGPTQGVGYANELIARLTNSAVEDHTTVNQTLDTDPNTFPLGRKVYADFSHDNDMTAIFFALRLFEQTPLLKKDEVMSTEEMAGYAASRTVPFAGRAVVEKMECDALSQTRNDGQEEMVRVIVNGRVLPLDWCGSDQEGRCELSSFIDGLSFARSGGKWDECFGRTGSVREDPWNDHPRTESVQTT